MPKILHVLLTGGVGSRLWPLSRQSRPKQYIDLFKGFSLFELSVKRNLKFADELMVVGNQHNNDLSEEALSGLSISYSNIVEATPRNTAPAITFAALSAMSEDILLITPSDHIIKEGEAYEKSVKRAIQLAKQGYIVTFGLKPDKPETGFGYIECNEENVISFREKPDLDTAIKFLEKEHFLWNSGIFCFKAGVFLAELRKYEPEVYYKSLIALEKSKNGRLDIVSSLEIPSISVDYAVMEKSDKIKVVASEFEWSDMGSFESVYNYLVTQGHPVDEKGNMVIGSDNYTAFVGLENTILVCTDDANLVLSKTSSQKVKSVYNSLEPGYLK